MNKRGLKEYVQVLRVLETFAQQEVTAAIEDALRLNAISYDAVKHLVLARVERRTPKLDLSTYPYLAQPALMQLFAGYRYWPSAAAAPKRNLLCCG